MEQFHALLDSIVILVALTLVALWLKQCGIVSSSHAHIFSRLVTDFSLPALIFVSLSQGKVTLEEMVPVVIMTSSIILCCFFGWLVGRKLNLSLKELGSFVMVAGFGSSSTLGYSLIAQVFKGNQHAMMSAMLIGELGACLPVFT